MAERGGERTGLTYLCDKRKAGRSPHIERERRPTQAFGFALKNGRQTWLRQVLGEMQVPSTSLRVGSSTPPPKRRLRSGWQNKKVDDGCSGDEKREKGCREFHPHGRAAGAWSLRAGSRAPSEKRPAQAALERGTHYKRAPLSK